MSNLSGNQSTPSEFDDDFDNGGLPMGQIWAYPCKLTSCPDYGKSWTLRSNFLLHLYEGEAHKSMATTPAARRAIEIEWRYATDPTLPPRAAPDFRSRDEPDEHVWTYSFKDEDGNVVDGKGTLRQTEMHKNSRRHFRAQRHRGLWQI